MCRSVWGLLVHRRSIWSAGRTMSKARAHAFHAPLDCFRGCNRMDTPIRPSLPRRCIMCCFSRRVEKVANTNIFARASKDGRQFLVYNMLLSTKEDLAMILPIPVPKNTDEEAVKFINLEKYPDFF